MPKKKGRDIFAYIEKVYGQIPKCLVVILRSCGFDNTLAVEFIDEKAIEEIELHMRESGKEIIEGLDCCSSDTYKEQNLFVFTPGHKRTLLAIAQKTRELNQAALSQRSSQRKTEPINAPDAAVTQHHKTAGSTDQADVNDLIASKDVESASQNHFAAVSLTVEEKLKSSLITKLHTSIRSKLIGNKTKFEIDNSHVIAMSIQTVNNSSSGSSKCVCPYCQVQVTATCKNGNWKISNVVRHISSHFTVIINVSDENELIAEVETVAPGTTQVTNNRYDVTDGDKLNAKVNTDAPCPTHVTNNCNEEIDAAKQLEILKEFDPFSSHS